MEKLKKIMALCKCSVSVTINQHRDYYEPIEQYLIGTNNYNDIDKKVLSEIVRLDELVEIQFYPDTPIGSYCVYHYDLESAIDKALEILEKEQDA